MIELAFVITISILLICLLILATLREKEKK